LEKKEFLFSFKIKGLHLKAELISVKLIEKRKMGRNPVVPEVVEKEVTANPIEVDITPKQAEEMKLIESKADRVKKARSEKQIEATKKLIEKNKAWREKLKKEKAEGKPDNLVQGLLAEKADEPEKKTRIRFRIKKPAVHPRPNHHLKRKVVSKPSEEESDVGGTTEASELDTDAVVEELKKRANYARLPPAKKFVCM
jgi:hypothetical protein